MSLKGEKEIESFLVKEMQIIKERYSELKNPLLTSTYVIQNQIEISNEKIKKITPSTAHFCNFCYVDYLEIKSTSPFYAFEYYRHLAGKKHENEVKKYLKLNANRFPSLRSRFKPKYFKFTKNSFQNVSSIPFLWYKSKKIYNYLIIKNKDKETKLII